MNRYAPPLQERFWQRVRVNDGPDACWDWTGGFNRGGYGHISDRGSMFQSHRLSWEWTYGPIPEGMNVMHKCDNPPCVRPTHLRLGTHADNVADRHAKQRDAKGDRHGTRTHPETIKRGAAHWQHRTPEKAARGERVGGAKLTPVKVTEIRSRYAAGETLEGLAEEYGTSFQNIHFIVQRKTWKHIP